MTLFWSILTTLWSFFSQKNYFPFPSTISKTIDYFPPIFDYFFTVIWPFGLWIPLEEDLVHALRDYPEDRALLGRKAKKAAKEVAAKQASNAPAVSKMSKDVIVPLHKEPRMVTALLQLVPKTSNISKWLTDQPPTPQEDILIVEKEEILK